MGTGEVLQHAGITSSQASYSSKLNFHSFLSHAVFLSLVPRLLPMQKTGKEPGYEASIPCIQYMQLHSLCIQNRHIIAIAIETEEQDYTNINSHNRESSAIYYNYDTLSVVYESCTR